MHNSFPNIEAIINFRIDLIDNYCDTLIAHDKMMLAYEDDCGSFGELRLFHSKWDSNELGYVYDMACCEKWLKTLKQSLRGIGFGDEVESLDFSESGMQGRNFVSLDINSGRGEKEGFGMRFIKRYKELFGNN